MSNFMGVSISPIVGFIMITSALLIPTFPAIMLGYLGRFKTSVYIVLIWILIPIAFSLYLQTSGYAPITFSSPIFLKEIERSVSRWRDYIPLYTVALLLGVYLGRNNQKWKLDNKLSVFQIALVTAILPIIWFFLIYGRIFM